MAEIRPGAGYGRNRLWREPVMAGTGCGGSRLWRETVMAGAGLNHAGFFIILDGY